MESKCLVKTAERLKMFSTCILHSYGKNKVYCFAVKWTHICIALYKNSDFNYGMNTLIPSTAIKIYKYEMKSRLTNSKSDTETLYTFVQSSLKTNQYIAK